jgi:hypothetical protein
VFADFHGKKQEDSAPTGLPARQAGNTVSQLTQSVEQTAAMMNMLATLTAMQAMNNGPKIAGAMDAPLDNSAPENIAINCTYPEVEEFFAKLASEHPRRNLADLGFQLATQDFFCIDELADEKEEFFQKEPYCLSQGNAKFVVRQVREAIAAAAKENS